MLIVERSDKLRKASIASCQQTDHLIVCFIVGTGHPIRWTRILDVKERINKLWVAHIDATSVTLRVIILKGSSGHGSRGSHDADVVNPTTSKEGFTALSYGHRGRVKYHPSIVRYRSYYTRATSQWYQYEKEEEDSSTTR